MTLRSMDYASLSQTSYDAPKVGVPTRINGVDYKPFRYASDPHTGFQATAYEHVNSDGSHDVVIAYRGSDFKHELLRDGGTDAGMVLAAVNA